jgi:hypothetical protein
MAGPRFPGWTHKHSAGKGGEAAPYQGEARKLLGYVMEDAARNGLLTHKAERHLPDGTKIIAEKHGDIPRIVVIPSGSNPKPEPLPFPDNFVVLPRNGAHPSGGAAEYPEMMLRREDGKPWRTLFYDTDVPQFAAVAPPRGTYKTQNGTLAFPEGIQHGGNVDWRAKNDVRVSWYGPSSRYWYDGWRQPSAQYKGLVFMLGQVLLDTEQYATDSEIPALAHKLVMGAAIDLIARRLYVIQAAIDDVASEDFPPPPAEGVEGCNTTPPAPVGEHPIALYRYALAIEDKPDAMDYVVVDKSHEILWSGALHNANNPWFFNQDITHATSYSTPDNVDTYTNADRIGWTEAYSFTQLPSASSLQFEMSIQERSTGGVDVDVGQNTLTFGAAAPIATDYLKNERFDAVLKRTAYAGDGAAIVIDAHDTRFPLYYTATTGTSQPNFFYQADLFWMDLRERAAMLHVNRSTNWQPYTNGVIENNGITSVLNELFAAKGQVVSSNQIGFLQLPGRFTNRGAYFLTRSASYSLSPMAFMYWVCSGRIGPTNIFGGSFGLRRAEQSERDRA